MYGYRKQAMILSFTIFQSARLFSTTSEATYFDRRPSTIHNENNMDQLAFSRQLRYYIIHMNTTFYQFLKSLELANTASQTFVLITNETLNLQYKRHV